MKIATTLLALSVLLAASAANADQVSTNASIATSSNATITTRASIQGGEWLCTPAIWAWYYNSWSEGPYDCTTNHDSRDWSMLSAYRSGGTQGVHWKYTKDPNDGQCLQNWKYYTSDGNGLIATVDRTTFVGDSNRWCALKVYRSGGVQGKQWNYCSCQYFP